MVLDQLNAQLRRHGLWFPVDVSTAAQATLGGMTGNNSCGSRSLAYGYMVHRVAAIDAWLADGTRGRFGPAAETGASRDSRHVGAAAAALGAREGRDRGALPEGVAPCRRATTSICLAPARARTSPSSSWAARARWRGSSGSRSTSREIPKHKALGVAHFPRFYDAMDAAQHIVKLGPCAVELVDRTMIDLSRAIPAFAPTINAFVRGEPDAILLVEFAGDGPGRAGAGREAALRS